jgi:hypothetical protein
MYAGPAGMQPLRERASFESDMGERQVLAGEEGGRRLRLTAELRLANNLSGGIHHTDAAEFQDTSSPA